MSDEVRVSETPGELTTSASAAVTGQTVPLAGGDSTATTADATATQPATEPKLVPQSDLDALRATLDRRFSQEQQRRKQIEQELSQYRQQFEQQTRAAQMSQRYNEYLSYYAATYPDMTDDAIYAAAEHAVREEWAESEQQQQFQSEVEELRSFKEQVQTVQTLTEMRDAMMTNLGLSAQEVKDATKHLSRSDPNFAHQAWAAATAAGRAKHSAETHTQAAQNLVSSTPFPGRSGAATGAPSAFVLPEGMVRGTPEHLAWVLKQEQAQGRGY